MSLRIESRSFVGLLINLFLNHSWSKTCVFVLLPAFSRCIIGFLIDRSCGSQFTLFVLLFGIARTSGSGHQKRGRKKAMSGREGRWRIEGV